MRNLQFLLFISISLSCSKEKPLMTPTNLSTAITGENIELFWSANDDRETGFIVERKTDTSSYIRIGEPYNNETYFIDTTIKAEINYYYRIQSINSNNKSNYTDSINAIFHFPSPDSIWFSSNDKSKIILHWNDNCAFENGYKIERAINNNFIEIGSVSQNITEFNDINIDTQKIYQYRVRAFTERNVSKYSKIIKIGWNYGNYSIIKKFSGHTGPVWTVCFSPDGKFIATGAGTGDGTVKLWDVSTGNLVHTFSGFSDVRSVCFSTNGDILAAAGDYFIKLWQINNFNEIMTLYGAGGLTITIIRFSPDGNILASGSAERTIRLWNINNGSLLQNLSGHTGTVWSLAFSPDGHTLASGGGGEVQGSFDSFVRLWDVNSGTSLKTYNANTILVWSLEYNKTGDRLGCGTYEGKILVWDTSSDTLTNKAQGERVSFDSNYTLIASSNGSIINLWNVLNSSKIISFSSQTDAIYDISFSPINKTLISSSYDSSVKLWSFSNRWIIIQ